MKNIKKISVLLAILLIISASFSITALANDNSKEIEANNKIFAFIPADYELSVYDDDLAYSHENGNYIEFCVDENTFAPKGITALNKAQVEKVFEHYYLNEGDLESINDYTVAYDKVEKIIANGYNCYYLAGRYAFSEEDINTDFAYYFHSVVLATKEEIFVVAFESYEAISKLSATDLPTVLSGIVLNGTPFEGDKPENNADYDFSSAPDYDEVVLALQGNLLEDIFEDESMVTMLSVIIALFTIVPTAILIIIAIALIVKFTKNKKKLAKYEATYGNAQGYNPMQQNFGGYGYNQPMGQPTYQPVNQPYQAPVNPAYNPTSSYQNPPQTPSYVTNALNNIESKEENQPTPPIEEQAESQNN